MDGMGGLVSTPSIVVHSGNNSALKIGRFYRERNQDTFLGFKLQTGNNAKPPKLFPVDRSKIPSGYTLTITNKKMEE